MFDRFTDAARTALVQGQAEAMDRADDRMGTEHLLLGLLREGSGRAALVLADHGVDLATARPAIDQLIGPPPAATDAGASLATIGIDLDSVQGRLTDAFGEVAAMPAPVPYDDGAKQAIQAAVTAAGDDPTAVDTGHELLGILEVGDSVAVSAISALGVDPSALAAAVRASTTTET